MTREGDLCAACVHREEKEHFKLPSAVGAPTNVVLRGCQDPEHPRSCLCCSGFARGPVLFRVEDGDCEGENVRCHLTLEECCVHGEVLGKENEVF